jgi:hypothetical protein
MLLEFFQRRNYGKTGFPQDTINVLLGWRAILHIAAPDALQSKMPTAVTCSQK